MKNTLLILTIIIILYSCNNSNPSQIQQNIPKIDTIKTDSNNIIHQLDSNSFISKMFVDSIN